jgi:hypothetical protein
MEIDLRTKVGGPNKVILVFPNGTARFDQGGVPGASDMLTVGTSVSKLGWIAEVKVPFSALGVEARAAETGWEFQIGALSDQWKAWKSTGGSNYSVDKAGTWCSATRTARGLGVRARPGEPWASSHFLGPWQPTFALPQLGESGNSMHDR